MPDPLATFSRTSPVRPLDPGKGAGWSRRSFLTALSGLVAGVALGGDLYPAEADAATAGQRHPTRHHRPRSGVGSSDDAAYTPVAPFAMTATSELTEDYFVFQTHQIDPSKDTVVAYSRADGQVEAILVQDGAIKQIYRDTSQAGGWNVYTFPDAATGVIDLVAGVSRAKAHLNNAPLGAPVLKVFYRTQANPDVLHVAVETSGSTPGFTTTTVPWSSKASRLQLTVGFDDSLLVSAMVESSSIDATDAVLSVYTDSLWSEQDAPTYGTLSGFSYNTGSVKGPLPPRWSAAVSLSQLTGQGTIQLALPAGTYGKFTFGPITVNPPSINRWYWAMTLDRPANTAMSSDIGSGYPPVPSSTTTGYSIEYSNALGSGNDPTLVVRTTDTASGTTLQRLWVLSPTDPNGGNITWAWTELLLPVNPALDSSVQISTGVSPLPSSEIVHDQGAAERFMDTFVVADGTLSVIRQAPQGDANLDYSKPVYCPAIPLQPDVAAMTSQANVSTGNELLVAGDDGILQCLVKDPVSGLWSDNPVHLPADDMEQTSTYRVTLGVIDAWQAGVPNQTLQVSADSQVTALVNGAAVTLNGTATSVSTDSEGEVTIALLADGLSAPTLTVSGSGMSATTVNPSAAINTFMQGSGSLNALSPLTSDTLASAKAADGALVAPGAADQSAAKDAVTTMGQAASQAAGLVGAEVLGSSTSGRDQHGKSQHGRGRHGKKRRGTKKHRRQHRRPRDGQLTSGSKAELTGVLSDIDKWGNDAMHAIRKGAVAVQKVAYDAEQAVFTVAADFVHWADNVVNIVVHTMVDAAHVIEALLVELGGEIKKAVEWLRAEVGQTLSDAAALGNQYLQWLDSACGFVSGLARMESTKVQAWLTAKQASVKSDLLAIANGYAGSTTLDTMAANPPTGLGAGRRGSGTPRGGLNTSLSSSELIDPLHGDWFLKKIKNEILGDLTLPALDQLTGEVKSALSTTGSALDAVAAAFVDYLAFLRTVVTAPDKVMSIGVHDLLLATLKLVDAVFDLARGLAAALLSGIADVAAVIPTILQTPLKGSPFLGLVMKLAGVKNPTVGQGVAMIFAFPAVVSYKAAHGGQGRPFATSSLTRSRLGSEDVNSDLKACAGGALVVWAGLDFRSQILSASRLPVSVLHTAVDIAAPFIVGLLTVPSTQGGEPYFSAPVTSNTADLDNFLAWLLSMLPGALTAISLYFEKTAAKDPDLPGVKRMILIDTCMSGVIALALSCAANKASTSPTGSAYALAVLLNMAYIVAPALDDEAVEASDGISAIVAAVITLATGGAGGLLYSAPA